MAEDKKLLHFTNNYNLIVIFCKYADGTPPADAPANLGEFLVEAQQKSYNAQKEEEEILEEEQSQPQPQLQQGFLILP